jgi:hypothetical protein
MKKHRPNIPIRDNAGSFEINNPDDGTPIKQMINLGDDLLLVTDLYTYKINLADKIDPAGQNPALPPVVQQKLLNYGVNSKLVCGVLLQSKVMFRKEFQSFDVSEGLSLALECLSDLLAADEISKKFKQVENCAIESLTDLNKNDSSLTLPTGGDVRSVAKSFFQKIDHFCLNLKEIIKLIDADTKGLQWSEVAALMEKKYGQEDSISKLLRDAAPFLKLVRDTRNCLEHINSKGVNVLDFTLDINGDVAPPTISVNFRGSSLNRCSVSFLMDEVVQGVLSLYEMIIVHLCNKSIQPFCAFPVVVGPLPESLYQSWYVRFSYGLYDKDKNFSPMS